MRRLIAVLALLFLAACDDGPTEGPRLTGTYTVAALNGVALPAPAGTDFLGGPVALLDGTLRLRSSDFTFTYRTQALGGTGTLNVYGTVERSGNTVQLTDQSTGDVLTGTETAQGLALDWNGWRFDLHRR